MPLPDYRSRVCAAPLKSGLTIRSRPSAKNVRNPPLEEIDFTDEFCAFVRATIPALRAAELLLLLRAHPERWWVPGAALARLGTTDSVAAAECTRFLELFQTHGLVVCGPEGSMRYRPASAALAAQADKLAQAYAERPVTLIRLIYQKPQSRRSA